MRIKSLQGTYKYTERCKHINARESFHAADHNGIADYIKSKILWQPGESKLYKNENPLEAGAKKQTLFFQKSFGAKKQTLKNQKSFGKLGEKSNFKNSEILSDGLIMPVFFYRKKRRRSYR